MIAALARLRRTRVHVSGQRLFRVASICIATAVAALAQPTGDDAPESLKQLTLEQLSQIEITSVTKEAVPAFKTPAAISILTNEQIRQSGMRTIPDLLRLVPGVNVAQVDANEWAIGIRGFQGKLSKSVLVLIDGRSVYTPLFAGVYWDMQDVMIEDIDRIEVIRGPGGTIWGSNAVNGVINIITKSSRDTHGELVSAGGGNREQGAISSRWGGGSDAVSYRVYGKGFTRGPEFHSDGKNFDDWRRGQLGFRIDAAVTSQDELTVQGDVFGGEAGQALQLSAYSPPANPTVQGEKGFNGANLMAAWKRTLSSGADIQVRAYYDRTDREELNYQEVRNTFDIDFIHRIPLGRNDVTWGLGVRSSPSHFFERVPTVQFFPAKQTYNIFSAFVQDDIALVPDRLALTIGAKIEHTTYSGANYQPGVRLSWTPSDKQTIWTAVTRAVRTASRIEDGFNYSFLAQPAVPLYLRLIGDGQFTPEQLVAYEAGYRHYIRKRGFVSIALFHNRYDDLLSVESGPAAPETTPSPPHLILPLQFRNGILANSTGGEINSVWDLRSWWRLRGSYSLVLLDAKRKAGSNDASTVGQLEGDTASHSVVVQSSFQLPRQFELNLEYQYVSAITDQRVPAYSTGNIRLGWRPRTPWEFEVVGQNLLQPSHVEYGGVPGPLVGIRRGVYAGITWRR